MRKRMEVGKLPSDLLAQLLARVEKRDPRVVVGPGVGQDAAVIDAGGPRLLVAKSDPVTFATDLIGWYAVHVNANDIACTGARPAWFLATILLPEGAAEELAGSIFDQIVEACRGLAVEIVGGHTEITYKLDRPIVVGAMLGEVEREALVRPSGAQVGDALVLTKGIAIEGTALLAREAAAELEAMGVSREIIEEARQYIFDPGISVVRDAEAACRSAPVHAMHDPTEGGLATALYEMATACGLGVSIQEDQVEVLAATQAVCRAAGLDPLGLLASGSLLAAVSEGECDKVISALAEAGIAARRLGSMVKREEGVIMGGHDQRRALPHFARDEVARFLAGRSEQGGPE